MSVPETLRFSELALSAPVLKAIEKVGYEQPSPIQAASIPHLLNGKDLLGVAQTGTGKTAAFALPLLSNIVIEQKSPQILVLTPTRELAIQVAEAFKTYASQLKGFHVLPIYGGQDMGSQLRQLKRGAQVIVGTPGRIMDHLRRKSLNLNELNSIVLDEADEMLRMGFIDDVEWILEHTPEQRQVALFSATMPKPIKKVADNYLKNPQEVRITRESSTGSNIEQCYLTVNGFERKLEAITRILEGEGFDAMIIFVRTKTSTVELAEKLEARGYAAAPLNGDMNQQLRERTISRLKKKQLDIIVATDVAARGIDVERVSHVLNFDIPYDSEAYVHRIGRTGRAGRSGKAILFVAPREKRLLHSIERATGKKIVHMDLPSGKEVSNKRIERFLQQLDDTLNTQKLDFFYDLLAEYSNDCNRSAEEIACALAYLLQKDRPLEVEDAGQSKVSKNKKAKDKKDKPDRTPKDTDGKDIALDNYRIEIGREHQVKPGDIVKAISQEAGLERQYIGHIKLHDNYSIVELPTGMPREILQHLKQIQISDQALNISRLSKKAPAGNKGDKRRKPATKAAKKTSKPRKRKANKS